MNDFIAFVEKKNHNIGNLQTMIDVIIAALSGDLNSSNKNKSLAQAKQSDHIKLTKEISSISKRIQLL